MDENKYISVSNLNRYIKFKLNNDEHLQEIYLKGEISNYKEHTSGHLYFSLKDLESRIKVVMFKQYANDLKFIPKDGLSVLVKGRISVYEVNGEYQLNVFEMMEDGIGNLYVAYEKLKEKFFKEGLFDLKHKLEIPKYPKRIGVITAPTGAAIKDILTTIKRRYPICDVILLPSLVQGEMAKDNIVKQLKNAINYNLDLLIIGRGGGSIEDLWPFNEEIVVKEVFNCPIPIISAIGHEIDFTITDYVSDLRAPTPTAAAELAVPNLIDILNNIENYKLRLNENLVNKLNMYKIKLNKLKESYIFKKPISIYEIQIQKLDNLIEKINVIIKNKTEKLNLNLYKLKTSYILNNPQKIYELKEEKLLKLINKCEILNPLSALKRGYAIIRKDGISISDIKKIKKDDIIKIDFNKGIINSKVIEVKEI